MIIATSPTRNESILIGTTFCDVTMKQQALLLSTLLRSSFVRPHFILKIKEENTYDKVTKVSQNVNFTKLSKRSKILDIIQNASDIV